MPPDPVVSDPGAVTVDYVDGGPRDTPLTWAFVAVFCLGTVLVVFVTTGSAAGRTAFGAAAPVSVLIAALLMTVIGAAVTSVESPAWRWIVVSAVAVVWGGVCFLAGASLFISTHAPDFRTGMLLTLGAVGMAGVLGQLIRTLR
jgi:hypothetical protein